LHVKYVSAGFFIPFTVLDTVTTAAY